MSIALTITTAIENITRLLPYLKSFTGARRREYFDKVIQPLVVSLTTVNTAYDRLFLATRDKLEDLKMPSNDPESTLLVGRVDQSRLDHIKEEFSRLRRTDEGLRDTVRRDAQANLANISWPVERRLLVVISHYFLRAWTIPDADEHLDIEIKSLIKKGGSEVWPTPASYLYAAMENCDDIDKLVAMVDEARSDLRTRWGHVRKHYARVQAAIVNET